MNKLNTLCVSFTLVLSGAYSTTVSAIQPLTSSELAALCQNYQQKPGDIKSQQCVRYIKGFIDGILAMDSAANRSSAKPQRSAYKQRAIESRIGSRVNTPKVKNKPQFCLGQPVALEEVVSAISADMQVHKESDTYAVSSVHKALKARYSCANS